MFLIYNGDFQTGKTKRAIDKVNDILDKERLDSGKLITFLSKANEINRFKDEITVRSYGELNIFTNTSFILKEIVKFWPLIIEQEGLNFNNIVPKIINKDVSSFILEKLIHKKRVEGFFYNITSTNRELASNILMSMEIGALNKLQLEEIPKRLLLAFDNVTSSNEQIYDEMKIVIKEFKDTLLSRGIIQTSIAAQLYNDILLNNKIYIENVRDRFKYIIVDDGEYLPPIIVDLILNIEDAVEEGYIFYNENFVDFPYLAGDLIYLKDKLFKGDIIRIEDNYSVNKQNVINSIKNSNEELEDGYETSEFIKVNLEYLLRTDMIEGLISEIKGLLSSGYKEEDIAIIAPYRDNVLVHKLSSGLSLEKGILVLGEKKKIDEDSFLHSLITIALVTNKLRYSKALDEDIQAMVAAFLDIDLFKAHKLIRCFSDSDFDINIEKDKEEKLRSLISFINQYKDMKISVSELLRRAYLQFFIDQEVNYDTLSSCRNLVSSIEVCEEIFKLFWKEDMIITAITQFLFNVAKSQISYNRDEITELKNHSLVFLTVPSYLNSNINKKVVIVLDISSEGYSLKRNKNLFNREVLRHSYSKDRIVADNYAENLLRGLICKANDRIIFLGSSFSDRGYEQENKLSIILQDICS
ncbi:MAG: hypothetical protein AB6733_12715 [Clostridiaceae bacterium]